MLAKPDPNGRFLVLDTQQSSLVVLIGKVELDKSTGDQYSADQDYKDCSILPEQRLPIHSIHSVTSGRTLGGIISPSAFSVLKPVR